MKYLKAWVVRIYWLIYQYSYVFLQNVIAACFLNVKEVCAELVRCTKNEEEKQEVYLDTQCRFCVQAIVF